MTKFIDLRVIKSPLSGITKFENFLDESNIMKKCFLEPNDFDNVALIGIELNEKATFKAWDNDAEDESIIYIGKAGAEFNNTDDVANDTINDAVNDAIAKIPDQHAPRKTNYIDVRTDKTQLSGETKFSKYYNGLQNKLCNPTRSAEQWDNVVLVSLNSTTGEAVFEAFDNDAKNIPVLYLGTAGAEFNPKTKFVDLRQEKTPLSGVTEFKKFICKDYTLMDSFSNPLENWKEIQLLHVDHRGVAIFKCISVRDLMYIGKAGAEFNNQ